MVTSICRGRRSTSRLVVGVFAATFCGCETPELPKYRGAATSANSGAAESGGADSPSPVPNPGDVPPVTDDPRPVDAKDPVKGRRSRAAGGYLGAVGAARFWAEHKLIYDSITHALNLYNAEHGRFPSSHDEFMEKIVRFNNINLPELIEGEEYIYLPEEGEQGLQIRKTPTGDPSSDDEAAEADSATSADGQPADGQPAEDGSEPSPEAGAEPPR